LFGPGHTIAHDGQCTGCGAATVQPMALAVIIGRRFLWACVHCGHLNRIRLTRQNAQKLRALFHKAYGTRISPDEVTQFAANLHRIDEAITTEITV
jgi:hypothetical protein